MSTAAIVGILVALVVGGGVVWYLRDRKRRAESLQAQPGPEHTPPVNDVGSRQRAQDELVRRQEGVKLLEIRPLLAEQRELFAERWRTVQATFVDDPAGAVSRADALVEEVMKARGYPASDLEEQDVDLTGRQWRFVDNYRAAREIAEAQRRNDVTTEDLRAAVVCYGELFEYLLEDRERAPVQATDRAVERVVERDVAQASDDVPITDEHPEVVDKPRRDRNGGEIRP